MNKKKLIFILFIIIIIIIGIVFIKNQDEKQKIKEYIPAQEITEEELRKTTVTLYFANKETNTLMPETRIIDVKKLGQNPYKEIIELLIQGPKSENLKNTIPNGTILNEAKIIGTTVYLDFSKEFIDNHEGTAEKETQTINSIVNTLVELNEVNSVKILIDGEENLGYKDNEINFKNSFVKIK